MSAYCMFDSSVYYLFLQYFDTRVVNRLTAYKAPVRLQK